MLFVMLKVIVYYSYIARKWHLATSFKLTVHVSLSLTYPLMLIDPGIPMVIALSMPPFITL